MSKRVSALDATLRALGAEMGEWNEMDVPFSYPTNPDDEHNAVREAAGMWDTSALKKVHVRGSDALAVVDHLVPRNMAKIYVGKSAYSPILKEDGHFCDDAYIYHVGEDDFLVVHGEGKTMPCLEESAKGKNVSIELDDDLHAISVQGPKSIDLLDAHTPMDLRGLPFCHQADMELFGRNAMISRTGFSGERGYELFVQAKDAVEVWEQVTAHGKPMGLMAMSFAGIDKVHVESALLFYGAEATEENTPWEAGCAWSVSRTKGDFRGKEALLALEGKEKVLLGGVVADHGDAVDVGAELSRDGKKVGHVTSAAYSRRLNQSLALVHLEPSASAEGTRLEIKGETVQCGATVARIPFVDPEKTHLHAA
jgi:aminomethyltransferase